MLWRNSKKCVVSKNSCSKNFINLQEKHRWNCFFKQSYLTLTGNVLLENLWNFQSSFHEKNPRMPASAISCYWKTFRPKYIFQKTSHLFDCLKLSDFSHSCFDVQWHVSPGIKFATDVQELNIWIMEVSHMKIYSVL